MSHRACARGQCHRILATRRRLHTAIRRERRQAHVAELEHHAAGHLVRVGRQRMHAQQLVALGGLASQPRRLQQPWEHFQHNTVPTPLVITLGPRHLHRQLANRRPRTLHAARAGQQRVRRQRPRNTHQRPATRTAAGRHRAEYGTLQNIPPTHVIIHRLFDQATRSSIHRSRPRNRCRSRGHDDLRGMRRQPERDARRIRSLQAVKDTLRHVDRRHPPTTSHNVADLALRHPNRDRDLRLARTRILRHQPKQRTEVPTTQRLANIGPRPKPRHQPRRLHRAPAHRSPPGINCRFTENNQYCRAS